MAKKKKLRVLPAFCEEKYLAPLLSIPTTLASDEMLKHKEFSKISKAKDSAMQNNSLANTVIDYGIASGFLGYPTLSTLAQYGLMRAAVGLLADETTRTFINFSGLQDESGMEKVKAMNNELERLQVREHFHTMAEYCGNFGGGLLFIDRGLSEKELAKPFVVSNKFIKKDSIKRLVPIEPISVSPLRYNSTNPLRDDYFKVKSWYVTGVGEVHESHFLNFQRNTMPVLYRPAYNFFGISDVQIIYEYFLDFTKSKNAANRLLEKFSLTVLKTDVNAILYGEDSDSINNISNRISHLAKFRDNDGIYAINYEDEDIVQINTPLSGVTEIPRQALETLACVLRYPLVKFLGMSPGGMNATGESDMQSFHEYVDSQRQLMFQEPMKKLTDIMEINIFGDLQEDLSYTWETLKQENAKSLADLTYRKAETDEKYIMAGVLDTEEVRQSLSQDPKSPYRNIDPDKEVIAPEEYYQDDVDSGNIANSFGV